MWVRKARAQKHSVFGVVGDEMMDARGGDGKPLGCFDDHCALERYGVTVHTPHTY